MSGENKLNDKKSDNTNQISFRRLTLMWGLILIGYFMFVLQWYSISNLQGGPGKGGWGEAFFTGAVSPLANTIPDAIITLGRGIGSFFAGFIIAKFGHKYAVLTVLTLMVISFPIIIIAQNAGWNVLSVAGGAELNDDGIAVIGFSLFAAFRIFLAIGGTTLITYTNSVIAKMPNDKKSKFISINSFGFNIGAFASNVLFIIPGAFAAVNSGGYWTVVLSIFVIIVLAILICYAIFAKEVVPKENKKFGKNDDGYTITFGKVAKEADSWKEGIVFVIWLLSVVFINSGVMRTFIEQSPANFKYLVEYNLQNNTTNMVTSIKNTDFYWVWPAFICIFASGFFVGFFFLTQFGKTIFKRKLFCQTMFGLGFILMAVSICSGYFGGYNNPVALSFYLIFIFLSGIFLWSVQPTLLVIPQQLEKSTPKYVGFSAGMIWGIGYIGYTVLQVILAVFLTYIDPFAFDANVKNLSEQLLNDPSLSSAIAQKDWSTIWAHVSNSTELSSISKFGESSGNIAMIVTYWLLILSSIPLISLLPDSGYKKDGQFIKFDKVWNPFNIKHWNLRNKEYLIKY